MTASKKNVRLIKNQLRSIYGTLSLDRKDLATEYLVDAIAALNRSDFITAYNAARKIFLISDKSDKSESDAVTLFHNVLFAEDVVTVDSAVLVHKDSPYKKSLKIIAQELGFAVQEHNFFQGRWTKDYVVSTGQDVVIPVKSLDDHGKYMTDDHIATSKVNPALYYGPLGMNQHHESKVNIKSPREWMEATKKSLVETGMVRKTMLEGGNFFCAINKLGVRYNLIGENVVSETMAFNKLNREMAINLISLELDCPAKQLLVIPQWTYHLDLQMAYLGKGQFVVHSFKQTEQTFAGLGLSPADRPKVETTFALLKEKFEQNVIEATCALLEEHGFEVSKIFGCLFFLENCDDLEQLKYVPYCKSSEGFDGVLALMMNGFALDLGEKGRHFITSRCELEEFKQQYEESLQKMGRLKVHGADMLDCYDYNHAFEPNATGVEGARSVTDVAASMNGALRCQTSIVSKSLSLVYNSEGTKHLFFKAAEELNLKELNLSVNDSGVAPLLGKLTKT